MSTREQVHAAHSAHMSAFAKMLLLDPFRYHPVYRDRWKAAADAEEVAAKEYDRIAAEEDTPDYVPPPDNRSDDQREEDAILTRELREERGYWDTDRFWR